MKELVDRYGIDLDSIVGEVLEKELRKRILEIAGGKAMELSDKLRNISDEEVAKLIREDRESRGFEVEVTK